MTITTGIRGAKPMTAAQIDAKAERIRLRRVKDLDRECRRQTHLTRQSKRFSYVAVYVETSANRTSFRYVGHFPMPHQGGLDR